MDDQGTKVTTSDAELIERARSGDSASFGELWRRHHRSGVRVARQFTSSIDADDLVSEAFARIYQRVLAGGGPTGAFRPYLYTTIRNLASSWGAANREVQVDLIEEFEDSSIPEDPAAWALDRTLTARAFRTLPERWQTVLWYTEVEGMDPHEVAPIMGMTANGVAALSYRAREGLRKAWLQAHVSDATASGECQWSMSRIGEHTRNGLGARDRSRLAAHLETCPRCTVVSEEVDEVGSHLAMVMLPLLLGGAAGGSLLATMSSGSAADVASAVPDLPASVEAIANGGVLTAPIIGGLSLGAASGTGALVGGLAIVATIAGSIALGGAAATGTTADEVSAGAAAAVTQQQTVAEREPPRGGLVLPAEAPVAGPAAPVAGPAPDDIRGAADGVIGGVVGGVVGDVGRVVGGLLGDVTGSTPPAGHTASGGVLGTDISLNLTGSGTPGATVSLQAAGQIYATTTVRPDGSYTLITVVPGGISGLQLVQQVDKLYLAQLLGIDGILATTLGTLDGLVSYLVRPLTLGSSTSGLTIQLLG